MIRLICKISCFAGKLNHQISSGKQSQISRKFTPEMHDIVMVTFAGKLNHVCSLLKPQLATFSFISKTKFFLIYGLF